MRVKMKSFVILLAILLTFGVSWLGWSSFIGYDLWTHLSKKQTVEVFSRTFDIDRIYKSMVGPYDMQDVLLFSADEPELLWITGFQAVMVGDDGQIPVSQEYMCHSNLDLKNYMYGRFYGGSQYFHSRLFTLSQGQQTVRFPEGFGMPVISQEPISLTMQVLNLNPQEAIKKVRHKVTIDFVRDKDLKKGSIQPLFPFNISALKRLKGDTAATHYGIRNPDEHKHGPSCSPGENASGYYYTDPYGRNFIEHWVVKPGREVVHTRITERLALPFDTTVHYISVHLHPFAESLALVDLTTQETLFKSEAKNAQGGRIGLEHVDDFSSKQGVPLYKDHEYEIVSIYNNTTREDQDSMAIMYLYLLDKNFEGDRSYRENFHF
jgi:hypothetical protein